MTAGTPMLTKDLKPETIESLQELIRGLNDSQQCLQEAADSVRDDQLVTSTLKKVSQERQGVCNEIAKLVESTEEAPADEGTFAGNLRTIWTALRSGLNAGNPTVVLIEAERAEKVLLQKFQDILAEVRNMPIAVQLDRMYEAVKQGHGRILSLRNDYQNKSAT